MTDAENDVWCPECGTVIHVGKCDKLDAELQEARRLLREWLDVAGDQWIAQPLAPKTRAFLGGSHADA